MQKCRSGGRLLRFTRMDHESPAASERPDSVNDPPSNATHDSLLLALAERLGQKPQYYDGTAYVGCWRVDIEKLERDFRKWQEERNHVLLTRLA